MITINDWLIAMVIVFGTKRLASKGSRGKGAVQVKDDNGNKAYSQYHGKAVCMVFLSVKYSGCHRRTGLDCDRGAIQNLP